MTTGTRPMPAKQRTILAFIKRFIAEHAYPPTVREIADACGFASSSGPRHHLTRLADSGHITRRREISRGIAVTAEISPEDLHMCCMSEFDYGDDACTCKCHLEPRLGNAIRIRDQNAGLFGVANAALEEVRALVTVWNDTALSVKWGRPDEARSWSERADELEASVERFDAAIKEQIK